MNNKNIIIGIVVVVIVLILGIYWYVMSNPSIVQNYTSGTSNQGTVATNTQNNGTAAPGGTGTMYFTVTDAASAMQNVSAVNMTIDSVAVYSNTEGWVTISNTPRTFNLLDLKAKNETMLLTKADVPTDTYNQVKFHIASVMVTNSSGETEAATLPSSDVSSGISVLVNGNTNSVLRTDVMASDSLHTTNSGTYVFAPVLKLDSSSNANVSVDANNIVTESGGNIDGSINEGMNLNGQMQLNFMLPQTTGLMINANGIISIGQ